MGETIESQPTNQPKMGSISDIDMGVSTSSVTFYSKDKSDGIKPKASTCKLIGTFRQLTV